MRQTPLPPTRSWLQRWSLLISLILPVTVMLAGWSAAPALAQSTVTAVKGEVYWKSSSKGKWRRLRSARQLPAGAILKTGSHAMVRLIRADGGIAVIPGGKVQAADRPVRVGRPAQSQGFFGVLKAMFFSSKTRRKAALESTNLGLEPETDPQKDTRWLKILGAPPIKAENIEPVLQIASLYSERPFQNRAVALLERLRRDLPDHPGVVRLSDQARASFGTPATFTVNKVGGTREGPLRTGSAVREGDRIRLNYYSDTESFPYVFLVSRGSKGMPGPVMLHPPKPALGLSVQPRQELFLPGPGHNYRVDNNVGTETIWVWSCLAPVTDREALQKAAAAVAKSMGETSNPDQAVLEKAAPGYCPQAFFTVLHHR